LPAAGLLAAVLGALVWWLLKVSAGAMVGDETAAQAARRAGFRQVCRSVRPGEPRAGVAARLEHAERDLGT
jgi:hypothetical protein